MGLRTPPPPPTSGPSCYTSCSTKSIKAQSYTFSLTKILRLLVGPAAALCRMIPSAAGNSGGQEARPSLLLNTQINLHAYSFVAKKNQGQQWKRIKRFKMKHFANKRPVVETFCSLRHRPNYDKKKQNKRYNYRSWSLEDHSKQLSCDVLWSLNSPWFSVLYFFISEKTLDRRLWYVLGVAHTQVHSMINWIVL